jgi:hypothetical protein
LARAAIYVSWRKVEDSYPFTEHTVLRIEGVACARSL